MSTIALIPGGVSGLATPKVAFLSEDHLSIWDNTEEEFVLLSGKTNAEIVVLMLAATNIPTSDGLTSDYTATSTIPATTVCLCRLYSNPSALDDPIYGQQFDPNGIYSPLASDAAAAKTAAEAVQAQVGTAGAGLTAIKNYLDGTTAIAEASYANMPTKGLTTAQAAELTAVKTQTDKLNTALKLKS